MSGREKGSITRRKEKKKGERMKIVRGDELERDSGLVQGYGDIFYYTQLFLGFTLRNLGK